MNTINLNGVVWAHPDKLDAVELYPGVTKKTLWHDTKTGAKCLQVEIGAGAKFLELDVHEPGAEEVYVIKGTLNDGANDFPAGTFIHNPKGSSHVPQSKDGCTILVFFPNG